MRIPAAGGFKEQHAGHEGNMSGKGHEIDLPESVLPLVEKPRQKPFQSKYRISRETGGKKGFGTWPSRSCRRSSCKPKPPKPVASQLHEWGLTLLAFY
jgi:hypothetical protein